MVDFFLLRRYDASVFNINIKLTGNNNMPNFVQKAIGKAQTALNQRINGIALTILIRGGLYAMPRYQEQDSSIASLKRSIKNLPNVSDNKELEELLRDIHSQWDQLDAETQQQFQDILETNEKIREIYAAFGNYAPKSAVI